MGWPRLCQLTAHLTKETLPSSPPAETTACSYFNELTRLAIRACHGMDDDVLRWVMLPHFAIHGGTPNSLAITPASLSTWAPRRMSLLLWLRWRRRSDERSLTSARWRWRWWRLQLQNRTGGGSLCVIVRQTHASFDIFRRMLVQVTCRPFSSAFVAVACQVFRRNPSPAANPAFAPRPLSAFPWGKLYPAKTCPTLSKYVPRLGTSPPSGYALRMLLATSAGAFSLR